MSVKCNKVSICTVKGCPHRIPHARVSGEPGCDVPDKDDAPAMCIEMNLLVQCVPVKRKTKKKP
jgi:hypothetical protein